MAQIGLAPNQKPELISNNPHNPRLSNPPSLFLATIPRSLFVSHPSHQSYPARRRRRRQQIDRQTDNQSIVARLSNAVIRFQCIFSEREDTVTGGFYMQVRVCVCLHD